MSYSYSGHRAVASPKYNRSSVVTTLDTVDSLFDLYRCILPTQVRRLRRDYSELSLLIAVMISAINEFLGLGGSSRSQDRVQLQRAAELWFDGDPGARLPFERCCELLGLDADATRRAIKRLAALTPQGNGRCEPTAGEALESGSALLAG